MHVINQNFLPAVNSVKEEPVDIHITKLGPLPEEQDTTDITAAAVTIDSVVLKLDIKHEITVKEEGDKRCIKSEEPIETAFLNSSAAPDSIILKNEEDPVDGDNEILVLQECKFNRKERPVCRTLKSSKDKRQPVPLPVPELMKEPDEFVREVPNEKKRRGRRRKCQTTPGGAVCTLCGKTFASRACLKVHMRIHSGHRPFKCQMCGADFTRSDRLAEHMTIHSGAEDDYDTQSRPTKRKKRLRRGELGHLCDECGKSFRSASCLQAHLDGHAQLRSHKCDFCDTCFIHKSDLRRHLQGHMGRPYPCKECGREFRRADTLRKHMRRHTGERPFSCVPCGKTYRQHESLRLHRKHHKH
ncbi:zinc finger protein 239-like [Engraulis encrasicolus]|uniref:zinc finger protein 239-like n=1 Tax=Engraulis encrasicolus TaxID=184585 RepID=UPI002FD48F7B